MFTEPLPRNGHMRHNNFNSFIVSVFIFFTRVPLNFFPFSQDYEARIKRHEIIYESGDEAPCSTRWETYGSASRPGPFTSGEIAARTHWIGGWVDPRVGLDAKDKRELYCSCKELNPDTS
jgi:hypothetical protein